MLNPRISPLTATAQRAECVAMMLASSPWNRLYFTANQCEELLTHPAIHIDGALLEGTIAGFVATIEHGFGTEPMIEFLCVAEAHRNRGLGTQLIAHVEEVLFPGADNIYLTVSDINPQAQRLHGRLGYLQVGAMPNWNLEEQTEFIYRKIRRPIQAAMRARSADR